VNSSYFILLFVTTRTSLVIVTVVSVNYVLSFFLL